VDEATGPDVPTAHAHAPWWTRLLDPTRYLGEIRHGVLPRLAKLHRDGESIVGVSVALGIAILLQYFLPPRISHDQRWIFPIAAAILILVLVLGHGGRLNRPSPRLRLATLVLVSVLALANGIAGLRLVRDLVESEGIRSPERLLFTGAAIWLTNVIVFALVYWMFDRGGPVARFLVKGTPPDLLFPQQTMEKGADLWDPVFFDYLYTSFTNATAFSPTDVMPLSRWAKLAMMVESALSLILAILVVARAVNILH
jgi:uncharacterized membrane protein